jgi:hypothetical protein
MEGLQSLGNLLVWGPVWEQDKVPVAFPMDSIRVDVVPLDAGVSLDSQVYHMLRMLLDNL